MVRHILGCVLAAILLTNLVVPLSAQQIRTNWSDDGTRCWFSSKNQDGDQTYFIVDTRLRSCLPAFDRERLADALSKQLEDAVSPASLRIERIRFDDDCGQLLLRHRGTWWQLERATYELTRFEEEALPETPFQLFLPARNSGGGGESTHLTIANRLETPLELLWITRDGSERHYATIGPGETRKQHTYVGHIWLLKGPDDTPIGCFEARAGDSVLIDAKAVRQVRRDSKRVRPRRSDNRRPRGNSSQNTSGKWTAFVRDHNLWIRQGDDERQLSTDGSKDHSYGRGGGDSPNVRWSPNGCHLVAFQTKVAPERTVYLINSSPPDQLQPRLESFNYRKPGDELPTQSLHLFSLADGVEISVSHELFSTPWSLRFQGWSAHGDHFYLHYNERGHQVVRLDVAVADGTVRTIIEETTSTFIHYSDRGKSVQEALGPDEILWASERSGWNHLYRYSRSTGEVLNAVTSGEWNVKRIEKIDRENKQIWFYAVGIVLDQDPYHEHFCRVNFDGSGFVMLTEGDGTHRIRFEQDGKYFIDTYSRIDLAPVTELRDSLTGELVCELMREDISEHFPKRRVTERFVAKGRDGETDIWGIIHWPRDFDPDKKYPVVENIYAGPHDHHVPKSFRRSFGHQHRIADAGMIVVQIDGMGTAWRSKPFHDVCYKNLRDAGFPDRIAWMKAAAAKYPQLDLTRVGIYGGSAGGQNAMAALLWHHDFYKVAVADCGCHDNRMDKIWWNEQWMGWPIDGSYEENSNTENAHLLEGDLMLLVGELDRNVDPASTTQVVRQLIEHDKDFEFVLVAGAGHGSAETPWASRKRLRFLKEHLNVE